MIRVAKRRIEIVCRIVGKVGEKWVEVRSCPEAEAEMGKDECDSYLLY